jgi:thioredoxin 1
MAGNNVIEVTDSNFESEILQSQVPAIVDFWAEWCGPCKAISPTVALLASEYKGRVKVGQLDVDHNPETAIRYRIQAIPTLLAFKGGDLLSQIRGPRKRDLEKFFAQVASS